MHDSPIRTKVRIVNPLFKSANPSAHPGGFLGDINPNSEEVFSNAMIETGFAEIRSRAPWPAEAGEKNTAGPSKDAAQPETVRFQGMRMGYFCVDKDTKEGDFVLNQIVTLKEDTGK